MELRQDKIGETNAFQSLTKSGQCWWRCHILRQTVPCSSSSKIKCSTANSRQIEWWHDQAIGAGRAETTPTRQTRHMDERTQVTWCSPMQNFIRLHGNLELDALGDDFFSNYGCLNNFSGWYLLGWISGSTWKSRLNICAQTAKFSWKCGWLQ